MSIHSFLKVERNDPDWQFSPEDCLGKEFKIVDAHKIRIFDEHTERLTLRQNPIERDLLARRINIHVETNAQLDLLIVNEIDPKMEQVFLYNIHLSPGSTLSMGVFARGGRLNKHMVQITQEEISGLALYGIIDNRCQGDTEIITKISQVGRSARSNQLFYMTSEHQSQTVLQTHVIANNSASESQIALESNGLQSTDCGRCYSKIDAIGYANQVSINRVSIIENINREKINYMQNRGFSPESARKMLVDNFTDQAMKMIADPVMRNELREMYNIDP
jgi:Fe-S cluster assembly scaffold protein SufB